MSSSNAPDQDRPSERDPLLPPSPAQTPKKTSAPTRFGLPTFKVSHPRFRLIPLLGCLMILANEAEYFFKQAATMRAVESLYCVEYYDEHDPALSARWGKDIPEGLCKDDEIQGQVAHAWAWIMGGRMVCALVGALPLGRLADTWGRKPVLIAHKVSVICSAVWQLVVYLAYPRFPIWTIYLSGAPGIFGGNFDLALAVLFASYTDVLMDDVQRTSLFFITTSMQYVGQLFCPPVGGLLMNLDGKGGTPLVALYVGLAMGVLALVIACFIPETLERRVKGEGEVDTIQEANDVDMSKGNKEKRGLGARLSSWINSKRNGIEGVDALTILAIAEATLLFAVGAKAIDWFGMLQYPKIRLGFTYAQASIVPGIQALLTLPLYALLLPALTRALTTRAHLPPNTATLATMSLSLLFLLLGALLLALASTPALFFPALALYTLGAGFPTTVQSFLAGCVRRERLASVLAVLSIGSIAGKVGASVAWPALLGAGMERARRGQGEAWRGLPLFAAAAGFAAAGVGVGVVAVRYRRHETEKRAGGEEGEGVAVGGQA